MILNLKKPSDPARNDSGGIAVKKKGRRKGWVKKLVALVLVCAIAGGGAWYFLGGDQNTAAAANTAYTTAEVTRQTITSTITGSGTLEAADSYRQAEQKCFRVLCDYLHLLERWEKEYAPQTPEETWNPLFVEALQKKPYTEYLLDILLSGSMEERACVVAEYGKEVRKIEQRISEFTASHPAGRHERSRSLSAGAER